MALGLMSKPMLVTLPFVLLLLDYWPLGRAGIGDSGLVGRWRRLAVEKVPFFALSAASCVITYFAQLEQNAVASVTSLPISGRIENALVSYLLYLKMMVWPADLAAYYPYSKTIPTGFVMLATLILLLISVLVLAIFRRHRFLTVGWLWYLGTLIPVIGLVQVGLQAMADRYTYIPLIGIFIGIAWGLAEGTRGWRHGSIGLTAAATAVLLFYAGVAARQVRFWQNTETLCRHALAVTADNSHAHLNLGTALAAQGKLDEAGEHFAEAVRIRPEYAEARSNLGFVRAGQGRFEEAIQLYRDAISLKPGLAQTHFLLGSALSRSNRRPEAIAEYRTALQFDPDHPLALNDLAWMLATDRDSGVRDGPTAVRMAERACKLMGYRDAQFVGTLAGAYAEAGRFPEAVQTAEKARDLALAAGQTELAAKNEELLTLYRNGKPFRDK
jgi:tetratricopeptide (TPR) repeat protein